MTVFALPLLVTLKTLKPPSVGTVLSKMRCIQTIKYSVTSENDEVDLYLLIGKRSKGKKQTIECYFHIWQGNYMNNLVQKLLCNCLWEQVPSNNMKR